MANKPPANPPQKPKRKAEFYMPPNVLKQKVGSGGLNHEILSRAQAMIENNRHDYRPEGEASLELLLSAMAEARRPQGKSQEIMFTTLLYPAMQLKTNGSMFHYNLVTKIADSLIEFLEAIETLDNHSLEIIEGFYTTLRAVFIAQIKGDGGAKGKELYQALTAACQRYFEKAPKK